MKQENKKQENKTYGDEINELVKQYTGVQLGDFVLEQALKKVLENNKKIKEFKDTLLTEGGALE